MKKKQKKRIRSLLLKLFEKQMENIDRVGAYAEMERWSADDLHRDTMIACTGTGPFSGGYSSEKVWNWAAYCTTMFALMADSLSSEAEYESCRAGITERASALRRASVRNEVNRYIDRDTTNYIQVLWKEDNILLPKRWDLVLYPALGATHVASVKITPFSGVFRWKAGRYKGKEPTLSDAKEAVRTALGIQNVKEIEG